MIAAILGAALGFGKFVGGSVGLMRERENQESLLAKEEAEARADYLRDYNRNYLDRSDARALLKHAREAGQQRVRDARSMAAAVGAVPESQIAVQQAEADAYGRTVSDIAAQADLYKDAVQQRYDNRRAALLGERLAGSRSRAYTAGNWMMSGFSDLSNNVMNLASSKSASGNDGSLYQLPHRKKQN